MKRTAAGTTGIVLHGATGRMGRAVAAIASQTEGVTLRGALELRDAAKEDRGGDIPVIASLPETLEPGDVVIDFSRPEAIGALLHCLSGSKLPLVCGTTGLGERERKSLADYARENPVFYDENMSYGISAMKRILQVASALLRDTSDIEIIESHHRAKHDIPSGTAIALARVLDEADGRASEPGGKRAGRTPIHSIRAGGITGEHRVLFASDEEVVEISHRALSRAVFARGAIRAAQFVSGRDRGLFDMRDLLESRDE